MKTMELVLFIAALVLCVVTGFVYLKREDTDYKKFSVASEDLRGSVRSVEDEQLKTKDDQKTFASQTVAMLNDLNNRVKTVEDNLESIKDQKKDVNLNLKTPVTFQLVYKNEKQVLPEVPPQISGKKTKTPLLDKVGITRPPRVNN